jgi:arylsulfatase A-like enzyme
VAYLSDVALLDRRRIARQGTAGHRRWLVYSHPVSAFDAFATFAAAAGQRLDQAADGVNLMPFLTGEHAGSPHEILFWSGDPKTVHARMGDWKAVIPGAAGSVKLYNLATDPGEQTDLAARHPERVARIVTLVAEWRSKMAKVTP